MSRRRIKEITFTRKNPVVFMYPYYEFDEIVNKTNYPYDALFENQHTHTLTIFGKPYKNAYDVFRFGYKPLLKKFIMDVLDVFANYKLSLADTMRCILSTHKMTELIQSKTFSDLEREDPAAALEIKQTESFNDLETDYGIAWTPHEKHIYQKYYPFFPFEYILEFLNTPESKKLLRHILNDIREFNNQSPLSAETPPKPKRAHAVKPVPIQRVLSAEPVASRRQSSSAVKVVQSAPTPGRKTTRRASAASATIKALVLPTDKDKEYPNDPITLNELKNKRTTILLDKQYYDYKSLFQTFELKLLNIRESRLNDRPYITTDHLNTLLNSQPLKSKILPKIPHNNAPLVALNPETGKPEPTASFREILQWLHEQDPSLKKHVETKGTLRRRVGLDLKPYPIFMELVDYFNRSSSSPSRPQSA